MKILRNLSVSRGKIPKFFGQSQGENREIRPTIERIILRNSSICCKKLLNLSVDRGGNRDIQSVVEKKREIDCSLAKNILTFMKLSQNSTYKRGLYKPFQLSFLIRFKSVLFKTACLEKNPI